MAETPGRYCSNCGQELGDAGQFCPNCGSPAHQTARVPTPEADVPVPPLPGQQQAGESGPPPTQQAAASPQRRSTASKLFIGCASLVVVSFLFVGCFSILAVVGGSGGGGSGSGGSGSEPAAGSGGGGGSDVLDKPPPVACEVAKPCDLGESTVTVTKADKTDGFSASSTGAEFEGPFVIIEFDYAYRGTQPGEVEYHWTLEDGKGRTYNYSFDRTLDYAEAHNRSLEYREMNPGTDRLGAIVFEVAPDAEDFTLQLRDLIRPQTSKKAEIYF